ncbi:unnamed protein product, partial [Closterium sp. NIES-53]
APRLWQQYLHARLIRIGFKQLPHDQGMYRLSKDEDYILLIVYVDDLLYIGSTDTVATWFEGELEKDLSLTVSPTVTQYLGLNIEEGENAIYLNAAKYADTIAKRFALTPTTISTPYRYTAGNDKRSSTPLKSAGIRSYQRKLGCLLFAAVTCRPDLSYTASQLATYLKKPEIEHLAELDRALHYFVSTPTIGLTYYKNATTPTELVGYGPGAAAAGAAAAGAAPRAAAAGVAAPEAAAAGAAAPGAAAAGAAPGTAAAGVAAAVAAAPGVAAAGVAASEAAAAGAAVPGVAAAGAAPGTAAAVAAAPGVAAGAAVAAPGAGAV